MLAEAVPAQPGPPITTAASSDTPWHRLMGAGRYLARVPDPTRDVLISICERVLSAQLTLDEFQQAWPEPVENPALAPLREALEDGIEHTPGHRFRRGIDMRAWQRSPEYGDIESYLRRLRESQG